MATSNLFKTAPRSEWQYNIEAGGTGSSPYFYAWGYAHAASVLIEQFYMSESNVDKKNGLIFYPVCYLYRHALEIILKDLLLDLERFLHFLVLVGDLDIDKTCTIAKLEEKLGKTHDLNQLLTRLAQKLGCVGDERLDPSVIEAVQLLHSEDPTGQRFRYSATKSDQLGGSPSFASTIHVDLRHIQSTLNPAIEYLRDGVGSWLEHQLSMANDYISDHEEDFIDSENPLQ